MTIEEEIKAELACRAETRNEDPEAKLNQQRIAAIAERKDCIRDWFK